MYICMYVGALHSVSEFGERINPRTPGSRSEIFLILNNNSGEKKSWYDTEYNNMIYFITEYVL